jgi:folate-binding Fe-S cluster repair protein YgfZ
MSDPILGEAAPNRTLWSLTGKDAVSFLQGLVSNDLRPLEAGLGEAGSRESGPGIVWAALLTPQGKYLADFFVVRPGDGPLLIDIATPLAADTLRRLTMYRLRADVQIAPSPLHVRRGLGPTPADALPDPRHPALGWRVYGDEVGGEPQIDWDAIRVQHRSPKAGSNWSPMIAISWSTALNACTASTSARAAMWGKRSPPG